MSMKFENLVIHFNHDSRLLSKYEYNKLRKLIAKTLPNAKKLLRSKSFLVASRVNSVESIELSLVLCGPAKIEKLNTEYRGKDKVTDVLSFPSFDNLRKAEALEFGMPVISLGDIIICTKQARFQAVEHNVDFLSESVHLFVHGLLHLLGFDHEISKEEELLMQKKEKKLLANL